MDVSWFGKFWRCHLETLAKGLHIFSQILKMEEGHHQPNMHEQKLLYIWKDNNQQFFYVKKDGRLIFSGAYSLYNLHSF